MADFIARGIEPVKGTRKSRPVDHKLEHASEPPGGPVEIQIVGLHPGVSNSVCLGRSLRICIPNKSHMMLIAAGLGTTF